jgi:hypothetical protein
VQARQRAYPHAHVELWTADQPRLGRKPIVRRMWGRHGQRPHAVVQNRCQWCYL